jgi:hypothetical protein
MIKTISFLLKSAASMNSKTYILFFTILLGNQLFSQTAAEKVAKGYCECADKEAFKKYVILFAKNNEKAIRSEMDSIDALIWKTKRCVKETVVLTKEEGRKVPENEIVDALKSNCPDVEKVKSSYRKMESIIEEELHQQDLKDRHQLIEKYISLKEVDSATAQINEYIAYYGTYSTNFIRVIGYYYQLKDPESANLYVRFFVDQLMNEGFINDERKDQSTSLKAYVKKSLIELTTKYNQKEMTTLVNTIK